MFQFSINTTFVRKENAAKERACAADSQGVGYKVAVVSSTTTYTQGINVHRTEQLALFSGVLLR